MTAKINKNNSARKKLIPAIAMLTVSAMTLASSTYAWFTMSREVEVSNIQMTATVPEDIQISLGAIAKPDGSAISDKETTASLANGLGVLWKGSGQSATADNGAVVPPTNDWDWGNIADISDYYQFGKLIPASSVSGADIFFTAQANGSGKTLATDAKFYKVTDNLTAQTQSAAGVNTDSTIGADKLNATAHAVTARSGDTWLTATEGTKYTPAVGWDNTQDDGYYVDIPVWFRTSSSKGAALSVQAYVKPYDASVENNSAGEALYRAVRVAIIDVSDYNASGTNYVNGYATTGTSKGLLPIADGWNVKSSSTNGSLKSNPFALTAPTGGSALDGSILDWYGRTVATGASDASKLNVTTGTTDGKFAAVSAIDASNVPTYSKAIVYDPVYTTSNTANTVVTLLAPASGSAYGVAHKAVIRVWLEGEDPDCWNETANQDWSINLKFNNETASKLTGYGGTDITDVDTTKQINKPAAQGG